jgi:hypothetical protein
MVRGTQVKSINQIRPILSLKKETIINMPYITQEDRKIYDDEITTLVDKLVDYFSTNPTKVPSSRAGHLNYIITTLIKSFYIKLSEKLLNTSILKYSDHNEIMGVLSCAAQEWYRRHSGPYEDLKIKENGDV